MTEIDEAAEVRREASGLLRLMTVQIEHPRYTMGEKVSVALRISRTGEGDDACRIEVLCQAYGSLDADWDANAVAMRGNAGEQFRLQLDRRGYASLTTVLPEDAVLQGVGIVSSSGAQEPPLETVTRAEVVPISHGEFREEQIVQTDLRVAAQTDVGKLFTDMVKEFQSADGRVSARVTSSAGGQLSAVFSTSSDNADLEGAHIRIRFFTDAGTELKGETRLWRDQGEPSRLAGFYAANQTSLAPEERGVPVGSERSVNLAFDFEVYPIADKPKE